MKNTSTNILPVQIRYIFNLIGERFLARAAAIVMIVFVAAYLLSLVSPAAGEAWLYNQVIISGVLTASFAGLVSMIVLGFAFLFTSLCGTYAYKFAVNEIREHNGATKQLGGGGQYYVGPDVVVIQSMDETERIYRARVDDLIEDQRTGQWVVELPFRSGYVKIKDESAKGRSVKRGGEGGILPQYEQLAFATETESAYREYVNEFLPVFKTYAEHYRVEVKKDAPFMKPGTITTIILLLLMPLFAIAQTNTERVVSFLGASANEVPDMEEPVLFQFEKKQILRYGDKESKIGELVAQRVGADNGDYGQLKAVYRSGRVLAATGKQVIPATGTAEKPAPLMQSHTAAHNEALPPQKSFSESLPDSAAVANTLNQAKEQLPIYKQIVFKMFKPVWEFAAWLFFFLCPLFGIALGFCNLVSRSARQNGNLGPAVADQQIRFAAAAWWISIAVVGSAYICITASMFFWEWNPYVITSLCILGYIPAKWAINRLTPNGEYQETITTTRSNGRIGAGGGRQLGM